MQTSDFKRFRILPLVKAYPALSRQYGEVSCVAGIDITDETKLRWARLYPVPFRDLDDSSSFAKYQPILVDAQTHGGDRRPETLRPNRDSILLDGAVVDSSDGWKKRRRFVEPLMASSMCELLRRQERDGTSLGVFRPRVIEKLVIEEKSSSGDREELARAFAAQGSLFDRTDAIEQKKALEQIPYTFKYKYHCDEPECASHEMSITDWEIVAFFRHIRNSKDWRQAMRRKWFDQMCGLDRDTALIVGNMHQHPRSFLVLGVWWPPRLPDQLVLDDM